MRRLTEEFHRDWIEKKLKDRRRGRGYPFRVEVLSEFLWRYKDSWQKPESKLVDKEIAGKLQDWARETFPGVRPPKISTIGDWMIRPFRKRPRKAARTNSARTKPVAD